MIRGLAVVSPVWETRPGCPASRHDDLRSGLAHGCVCDSARRAALRYHKLRHAKRLPPGRVDPTGTVRRLRALVAEGHPVALLAAHIPDLSENYLRGLVKGRETGRVYARTAEQVRRVYDELSTVPGTDEKAWRYAVKYGCEPVSAWVGINMDDPRASPRTGEVPRWKAS